MLLAGWSLVSPAEADDRALLVGIETYRDSRVSKTPGGGQDAQALAELLQDSFDFPSSGIKMLLDDQATEEAIVSTFETWLIEGTEPGDRIFFSYAGHGSRLKDDNGDEDDGYDETLAPYDVDPMTGEHQIRDDLIDSLIARLAGRRAVLLFDSCHSGTVTRGTASAAQSPHGAGVRFLPDPEQFRQIQAEGDASRTRSGRPTYALSGSEDGADHRVFDQPEDDARISGIVTISAAGPGQLAYPVEVDGTPRGALSYVFGEVYRQGGSSRGLFDEIRRQVVENLGSSGQRLALEALDGASVDELTESLVEDVTVAALQTTIDTGLQQLQASGRLEGDQEPWFEVISEYPIREQPLFGDWEQEPAVAIQNPISPMKVELRTVGGRSTFSRGETLSFEITVDRAGYLYLLVFSEERIATCIFPNVNDLENRIRPGTFRIPTTDGYEFPVQEPYGRDVVLALVSEEQLELCTKVDSTWDEIFDRIDLRATDASLRQRTMRGIGVRPAESAPPPAAEATRNWQGSMLVVQTTQ